MGTRRAWLASVVLTAYGSASLARLVDAVLRMGDRVLKILIVDDDRWLASALKRALREHRPVVETDSVAAARRLTEGEWFDVVVSDYNMPRVTGLELLATAREMRDPPIFVLMSGDDGLEPIGAEAVLQKPFKMSDLILVITAAPNRKASAPTTRIRLVSDSVSSFAA